MKREALDRPFEAALIRERPGQGGKLLAYVEGHEYIRRLNEAFDGQWSFRIVTHEVHDRDIVVVGELSAEGLVKMAFGGAPVQGEIADCFKIAATDALKKASTLFGIGLHLYDDEASARARDARARDAPEQATKALARLAAAKPSQAATDRPTPEQGDRLRELAKRLGLAKDELGADCHRATGVRPAALTEALAAAWIVALEQSLEQAEGAAT